MHRCEIHVGSIAIEIRLLRNVDWKVIFFRKRVDFGILRLFQARSEFISLYFLIFRDDSPLTKIGRREFSFKFC